jgi:hypothetical protein
MTWVFQIYTDKISQVTKRYRKKPAATCNIEGEREPVQGGSMAHFSAICPSNTEHRLPCYGLSNRVHTVNFQWNSDLPGKAIGTISHPGIQKQFLLKRSIRRMQPEVVFPPQQVLAYRLEELLRGVR